MLCLGMKVSIFSVHMRDYSHRNGELGEVIEIREPCRVSWQDRSLPDAVTVRLMDGTIVVLPDSCVCPVKR